MHVDISLCGSGMFLNIMEFVCLGLIGSVIADVARASEQVQQVDETSGFHVFAHKARKIYRDRWR